MTHLLATTLRRLLCLAAAAGMVAPTIAGAAYHCRSAGAVIAAPCAQDERSDASAGGCCPGGREARDDDGSGECCELLPSEPPVLGGTQELNPRTATQALPPAPGPAVSAPPSEALRTPGSPRPPGDALLFLEQCRFLC
ncbi:MAG TPA: hypothetical protein VKU85_14540 [bacterium]|nr:hypothetical protein [bacterium]